MGLFGRSGSAYDPVAVNSPEPSIGARILNQVGENLLGVNVLGQQRRRDLQRQQGAFLNHLMQSLGPQYQDGPDASLAAPAGPDAGPAAGDVNLPGLGGAMPGPAPHSATPAYQAPARISDGLSIDSPELPAMQLMGDRLGVPLTGIVDILKSRQPHMVATSDGRYVNDKDPSLAGQHFANRTAVNNTVVDLNDPDNTDRMIPSAPVAGAMPVYDNRGRVVDFRLPQGSAQAIGAAKAAEIGAQEAAKLPFAGPTALATARGQTLGSPIKVPNPNGSESLMMGSDYFSPGGPGVPGSPGGQAPAPPAVPQIGAPGAEPAPAAASAPAGPAGAAIAAQAAAARPPGLGTSQSPADKALAEARAATLAKREALQPKEAGALRDLDSASSLTSNTIHQILGDVQDPKTGKWLTGGKSLVGPLTVGPGAMLKGVPGSHAHDLQQLLEHVNAATSMSNLQNLRDNSPTGAGLGRVTQTEIQLLAAMNGSTDQGQSPQQFEQNMRRQLQQLDAAIANRRQVYKDTYGGGQQMPRAGGNVADIPLADRLAEARRRGLIK